MLPFRAGKFFRDFPDFLHRLSGARELPQACSPLTGGSFSAPESRGARTASACSPFPGGEFFAEPQRGDSPSADGGNVPRPAAGQEGRHQGFYPLNSHFLFISQSGADQRPATASKRGTAVGLPLHVFLRLFAVHRQRTATQTVESTQARHKVNCPKGKRGSPGG